MGIFGDNTKDSVNVQNLTIIGKETTLSGSISASGDIRIDGTVTGDVSTAYRLVLGEQAVVVGNVSAKSSEISGLVEGRIKILETLTLTSSAKIIGDISANKLSVEIDAVIEGNCQIGSMFDN